MLSENNRGYCKKEKKVMADTASKQFNDVSV